MADGDAELAGDRARLHLCLPVLLQRPGAERALERGECPGSTEEPVHVLVAVAADERHFEPRVPDRLPVGARQPEDTVRAFFAMASTSLALGSWYSR